MIESIINDIPNLFDIARSRHGKSIGRQLREIVSLRFGRTKLGINDYYWYNFGNKRIYGDVDLSTFGGSRFKYELHSLLNNPLWDAVATDKLIMSMIFQNIGIPHPKTYVAACSFVRNSGSYCDMLSGKDELANYLRSSIPYPFFCKPIKGGSAQGCFRVEGIEKRDGLLRLYNGQRLTIENFLDQLVDPTGWGYLFQEAMMPHPDTIDVCGRGVSGCRVIMLLDDNDAYPFRVTWKLPTKVNCVDNYVSGTTGNLLADVSVRTGRVRRVVSGFGQGLKINPPHPDSRVDVVGRVLPDWDKLLAVLRKAAKAFPGFRFQHWDIGLTSKGPVVFELNTAGDLYLTELVKGSGVYDKQLREFIARHANGGVRSNHAKLFPKSPESGGSSLNS